MPVKESREERKCDRHGPYSATVTRLPDPRRNWETGCPTCGDEDRRDWEEIQKQREEREAAEKRERRVRYLTEEVGISPHFLGKTFADFQVKTEEQRRVLGIARNYATEFAANVKAMPCLAFLGNMGTGKTFLALAIVQALAASKLNVRYRTVQELIRELRDTWGGGPRLEGKILREYCKLDLLVLDEVGMQFGSDAEKTQLFEVFDLRYRAEKPTIIISNLGLDDIKANLGERVVDRLSQNGRMVMFTGPSWRARA